MPRPKSSDSGSPSNLPSGAGAPTSARPAGGMAAHVYVPTFKEYRAAPAAQAGPGRDHHLALKDSVPAAPDRVPPRDKDRPGRLQREPRSRLEEAVGLAQAIELDVLDQDVFTATAPRPATLFGTGAIEEIRQRLEQTEAKLVIVDAPLTPIQQRNLEREWSVKVLDRTGLILEIFGARARTREGQLQVELAALSFQRSRLVRSWTHLERQRGGFGFLGGPGESQLEIDRRLIDDRIAKIRRELATVTRTRGLHRAARQRVPYPIVSLVGYTNAGKSTLFNRLTTADVTAKDMLFATLDPTMREVRLPSGRKIILSDTVGFISDLPTHLIAAFRATLEEVSEAEIILHVRDISHPDTEIQCADVEDILRSMQIDPSDGHVLKVLNKIDLLSEEEQDILLAEAGQSSDRIAISAQTGAGINDLLDQIDHLLNRSTEIITLTVSMGDGATLAWLHRHGEVLEQQTISDDELRITARLAPVERARLERLLPETSAVIHHVGDKKERDGTV